MATKAQELQDRLVELEHKAEALSGKIEDYAHELQAQRDRQEDVPVQAPEAASGVPLPWWWNEDYPGHPDFEAHERAKVEAARARAKEPVIVDTSNEPVRPAGWDDPTPGNPYHPDVIAQRQAHHEREVAENRGRDRAVVEVLNSREVRGL
jgi:TolA-binding protein